MSKSVITYSKKLRLSAVNKLLRADVCKYRPRVGNIKF